MLYTIGSRVKLKQTGDSGIVSQVLGDELVEVRLDGGLGHIPVPTEALQRADDAPAPAEGYQGARFVPGKSLPKQEVEPLDLDLQYTILKPWGIQLAFDPVLRNDAAPERYRIYLINDTTTSIIFRIELQLNKQAIFERVGKLANGSYVEIGELKHNELNDQPVIDADIRPQINNGTGPRHHQLLKVKPKLFFNRLRTAPLLNRRVHHFILFSELNVAEPRKQQQESLVNYTQRQMDIADRQPARTIYPTVPNPLDLAEFPRELDLHIEALTKNPKAIAKSRYLSTQLYYFRNYLMRARQLGVERVYIIHGLGEGKLKKAIHKELRQVEYVKSFNNNYHPKYGNGATEVFLN